MSLLREFKKFIAELAKKMDFKLVKDVAPLEENAFFDGDMVWKQEAIWIDGNKVCFGYLVFDFNEILSEAEYEELAQAGADYLPWDKFSKRTLGFDIDVCMEPEEALDKLKDEYCGNFSDVGKECKKFIKKMREGFDMSKAQEYLEKYWSGSVKPKWHPPKGLFTKDPKEIADYIAKASANLKQAVARVNFFFNRGGYCNPKGRNYDPGLCRKRKKIIELLDKKFGKEK